MTTKQPFMPLYIKDYDDDTRHLTAEEDGVYGRLLRAMWTAGGKLPNNERRLAQIARIELRRWRMLAPTIMAFFTVAGSHIEQKRIAVELRQMAERSQRRQDAGKKGGRPRSNGDVASDARKKVSRESPDLFGKGNENKAPEKALLSETHARAGDAPARLDSSQFTDENPNGFSPPPPDEPAATAAPRKKLTVRAVLETKLSPRIARAVIEHRTALRKPLTLLAAERLIVKLAEAPTIANVSADEAASQMIDHGWRGFDAEWLLNAARDRNAQATGPPGGRLSREDSERAAWNKVLDDAAKGKTNG